MQTVVVIGGCFGFKVNLLSVTPTESYFLVAVHCSDRDAPEG